MEKKKKNFFEKKLLTVREIFEKNIKNVKKKLVKFS
jgi:hypothetical protein